MARTYTSNHAEMSFVGIRNGRYIFERESASMPGMINTMTCDPDGRNAVCNCKYHTVSHKACGAMKAAEMLSASVNQKEQA